MDDDNLGHKPGNLGHNPGTPGHNPGNPGHNPGNYVNPELCEAYRETIKTEIKGLEKTLTSEIEGLGKLIKFGLGISTAIITFAIYLQSTGGI